MRLAAPLLLVLVASSCGPDDDVRRTAFHFPGGTLWSESNFRGDLRDGETRTYHADGRVASIDSYRDGRLHGRSRSWFPDGALRHDGWYVHGRVDGRWQRWWEDGSPRSVGEYVDGLRFGRWSYWFENGNPYFVADHFEGRIRGEFVEYHENGRIKSEGSIGEQGRQGRGRLWDAEGRVLREEHYEAGELHGECRRFGPGGELLPSSGVYEHGVRVGDLPGG